MSRRDKDTGSMKVGRTIAQEWERQESESERLATRKKQKTRKILRLFSVLAVIGILAVVAGMEFNGWLDRREKIEAAKNTPQPTVEIIDESGSGITSRMKEYVAVIESDFSDLGYSVNRAIVPAGKNREIHLFLNGYGYYLKFNIDRGTAVSAEDADRMIRYLTERALTPEYVDLRVEGKGYYK